MTAMEVIDRIFKEPGISYELSEFQALGKPIHEILEIYPREQAWKRHYKF